MRGRKTSQKSQKKQQLHGFQMSRSQMWKDAETVLILYTLTVGFLIVLAGTTKVEMKAEIESNKQG